jgi:hypothetical protein
MNIQTKTECSDEEGTKTDRQTDNHRQNKYIGTCLYERTNKNWVFGRERKRNRQKCIDKIDT